MESFLRMSKGMLFHSFVPLSWKVRPPSVSLLQDGHTKLYFPQRLALVCRSEFVVPYRILCTVSLNGWYKRCNYHSYGVPCFLYYLIHKELSRTQCRFGERHIFKSITQSQVALRELIPNCRSPLTLKKPRRTREFTPK